MNLNNLPELEDVLGSGEDGVKAIFDRVVDKVDEIQVETTVDSLYEKMWEKQGFWKKTIGRPLVESYLREDLAYVREVARDLDHELADWKEEKRSQEISVEDLLSKPVGALLRFQDPERQARFTEKVQTAMEDISYRVERAENDLHSKYESLASIPFIGGFVRKYAEDKIPEEGLFGGYVNRQRETAEGILGALNSGLETVVTPSSEEEVRQRYRTATGAKEERPGHDFRSREPSYRTSSGEDYCILPGLLFGFAATAFGYITGTVLGYVTGPRRKAPAPST